MGVGLACASFTLPRMHNQETYFKTIIKIKQLNARVLFYYNYVYLLDLR